MEMKTDIQSLEPNEQLSITNQLRQHLTAISQAEAKISGIDDIAPKEPSYEVQSQDLPMKTRWK